jgi:hypothetical protein
MEMKPVDPASIAHLSGIFAPIQDEIDVGPLEVVQDRFPVNLRVSIYATVPIAGSRPSEAPRLLGPREVTYKAEEWGLPSQLASS